MTTPLPTTLKRLAEANPCEVDDARVNGAAAQAALSAILATEGDGADFVDLRPRTSRGWRPQVVAGVAGAVICAVVALAIASGGLMSRKTGGHGGQQTIQKLAGVPEAMQARFVSLRRQRLPDDQLPAPALRSLPPGTTPDQARLILSSTSTEIWFVPGPTEECLVRAVSLSAAQGPVQGVISTGCSPLGAVEKDGMFTGGQIVLGGRSAPVIATGVLPDRATNVELTLQDGSTVDVVPNDEGAFAQRVSAPVARISFSTAGSTRVIPLGPPRPAPSPPNPCPPHTQWCR
jgi:hypothetical protein